MLVLSRDESEEILIGLGEETITIMVVDIRGTSVRLGITAPDHVPIIRKEIAGRAYPPPIVEPRVEAGTPRV